MYEQFSALLLNQVEIDCPGSEIKYDLVQKNTAGTGITKIKRKELQHLADEPPQTFQKDLSLYQTGVTFMMALSR